MTIQLAKPGTWASPIAVSHLANALRLSEVGYDRTSQSLVWLEGRGKRGVLRVSGPNGVYDLSFSGSVKAKVGYGGGDFTLANGLCYFVCGKTGRLFVQEIQPSATAKPLTPTMGQIGSPQVSPDGKKVVFVHYDPNSNEDSLAMLDLSSSAWPERLACRHDFFAQPRWSPDSQKICYVAWEHPKMPWDQSALYEWQDGVERQLTKKLGAVFQPEYCGEDLVFVADFSGYNEFYRLDASGAMSQVTHAQADVGMPNWVQNMRQYCIWQDQIFASVNQNGIMKLAIVDQGELSFVEATEQLTDFSQLCATDQGVAFLGSSPTSNTSVYSVDLKNQTLKAHASQLPEESQPSVDDLSFPESIEYPTSGNDKAFGLFYPPKNKDYQSDSLPPLICMVHGGPTAQARAGFDLKAQAFTTRGYGVLQVNHRGSTGFGRAFMQKLDGNWGIYDVDDAVAGAKHLIAADRVDPQKIVIMGGSAGGFTTLMAMIRYPEFFAAGVSLYGIANQFALVEDTHKFEQHYSETLLGPLPASDEIYRERSPEFHGDKIKRPIAVYQGADDNVVTQSQAEAIVKALKANQIPHIYHLYEEEGHGFRKPETLEHYYKSVDEFLKEHVVEK